MACDLLGVDPRAAPRRPSWSRQDRGPEGRRRRPRPLAGREQPRRALGPLPSSRPKFRARLCPEFCAFRSSATARERFQVRPAGAGLATTPVRSTSAISRPGLARGGDPPNRTRAGAGSRLRESGEKSGVMVSTRFLTASPWRRRMARGQRAIAVPTLAFAPVTRAVPGVRLGPAGQVASRPPASRGEEAERTAFVRPMHRPTTEGAQSVWVLTTPVPRNVTACEIAQVHKRRGRDGRVDSRQRLRN
jgi:hypothetical protein